MVDKPGGELALCKQVGGGELSQPSKAQLLSTQGVIIHQGTTLPLLTIM